MVRLVLEQQPYGMGSYAADPAYNFLQTYVGQVRWGGQLAFRYTHASYLVADGARTFIGSMSWTDTGLGANRELGLIDTDPRVASAGERVFNADWNQRKLHSAPNAVVVSPDGARARILSLIATAHKSIDIYTERLTDPAIIRALIASHDYGLQVRVVTPSDASLASVHRHHLQVNDRSPAVYGCQSHDRRRQDAA